MNKYQKELNSIYMKSETAAMLMICERLDRIADKLDTLTEVINYSRKDNKINGSEHKTEN